MNAFLEMDKTHNDYWLCAIKDIHDRWHDASCFLLKTFQSTTDMLQTSRGLGISVSWIVINISIILLLPWDIYGLLYSHELYWNNLEIIINCLNVASHISWLILSIICILKNKTAKNCCLIGLLIIPVIEMIAFLLQVYALRAESEQGIFFTWIMWPSLQYYSIFVTFQEPANIDRNKCIIWLMIVAICNITLCSLTPVTDYFYLMYICSTLFTIVIVFVYFRKIIILHNNRIVLSIWFILWAMAFIFGVHAGYKFQYDFFQRVCVWCSYIATVIAAQGINLLIMIQILEVDEKSLYQYQHVIHGPDQDL